MALRAARSHEAAKGTKLVLFSCFSEAVPRELLSRRGEPNVAHHLTGPHRPLFLIVWRRSTDAGSLTGRVTSNALPMRLPAGSSSDVSATML